MSKTKAKKAELNAEIDKMTPKIDMAASRSADLKEQVKELQKELLELAKMQSEMDKIRQDTHAAFVTAKADLEQGIAGIEQALNILRDYYGGEEALLQQPEVPSHAKAEG